MTEINIFAHLINHNETASVSVSPCDGRGDAESGVVVRRIVVFYVAK